MRVIRSVIRCVLAAIPTTALAAGNYGLDEAAKLAKYDLDKDIPKAVAGILGNAFGFIGVLFLAMMLYGGYNWMTSMGEEDKVETGKKTIIWATIGLCVAIAAYAITKFVIENLVG
ncbi:hypothetical protein HZA86_02570 [Candidatus Uhrbacteria bacterium]|nr:hypothetical protein [Candidatus Uhrbacteria bacterium]